MRHDGRTRQKHRSGVSRSKYIKKPKTPKTPAIIENPIVGEYMELIKTWDTDYIEDQIKTIDNLHFMMTEQFGELNTILLLLKLELKERNKTEETK